MKILLSVFLFLSISVSAQTPAIPDTPAGHTLQAWLDAFNSGDQSRIQSYLTKYEPTKDVDTQLSFSTRTGGFELVGIDKNDRLHIEFRVKEKSSATVAVGKMDVKDAEPAGVINFFLRAMPAGMTLAEMNANLKIDAPTRARVIDEAVTSLNEFYVFPEIAKKMAESAQARMKNGEYDAIDDGQAFATRLTDDFRAVSHDKHLQVSFSLRAVPKRDPNADSAPNAAAIAQRRAQMEHNNCAFEKVEHLQSNIGYVKFNGFSDPDVCGPTVAAAMNFLEHVDALIVDLRDNGGGDPRMVAYICTYLFAEPTHLNDLYSRKDDKTTESWTLKDLPGPRLADKPVFILTSKRTFSGGEEFTYDLKNLKRATIIGETTGGGAHPVTSHRIDDHFIIGVPFARAINPISKTNWEGTGVEPDIKVPASDALDLAKKKALEQIRKKTNP